MCILPPRALLPAVPLLRLPRRTASVMTEHSEAPILALKYRSRSSKWHFPCSRCGAVALYPLSRNHRNKRTLGGAKFLLKRNVGRSFWHSWLLLRRPSTLNPKCVLGRPSFQDVVSSRHRAGYLGMGRTGDSLDDEFPPRIGGKKPSPRGSPCREDTG